MNLLHDLQPVPQPSLGVRSELAQKTMEASREFRVVAAVVERRPLLRRTGQGLSDENRRILRFGRESNLPERYHRPRTVTV